LAAFRFSMLWLSHHRCIDTTVEWRKYPDMATLDKSGAISYFWPGKYFFGPHWKNMATL